MRLPLEAAAFEPDDDAEMRKKISICRGRGSPRTSADPGRSETVWPTRSAYSGWRSRFARSCPQILRDEVRDPRIRLMTITRVKLAVDLGRGDDLLQPARRGSRRGAPRRARGRDDLGRGLPAPAALAPREASPYAGAALRLRRLDRRGKPHAEPDPLPRHPARAAAEPQPEPARDRETRRRPMSRRSPRRSRSELPGASGFLVVDKPAGRTSHDVVDEARRWLGTRRVGHLGTLDPQATGVLPLAIRQATKLIPFIEAKQKVYDGTIVLGIETDTLDAEGEVLRAPRRTASRPRRGRGRPRALSRRHPAGAADVQRGQEGRHSAPPPRAPGHRCRAGAEMDHDRVARADALRVARVRCPGALQRGDLRAGAGSGPGPAARVWGASGGAAPDGERAVPDRAGANALRSVPRRRPRRSSRAS